MDHDRPPTGGDRHRRPRPLRIEDADLRRVVPEVLAAVDRAMASDLWRRALECYPEVPVAVHLPDDGAPPTILHGVVDLAFQTEAGWELVDYKTDTLPMDALVARYATQVR